MKKLNPNVIAIALILLSLADLAKAATYTWHAFELQLNGIELKNACLTADRVQTISSLNVCDEMKEIVVFDGTKTSTDFMCVKWSEQKLSYPRKYTTEECVELSNGEGEITCRKYKKKTHIIPQTITIRTWTENGEVNNYPGITSQFTFPDCK